MQDKGLKKRKLVCIPTMPIKKRPYRNNLYCQIHSSDQSIDLSILAMLACHKQRLEESKAQVPAPTTPPYYPHSPVQTAQMHDKYFGELNNAVSNMHSQEASTQHNTEKKHQDIVDKIPCVQNDSSKHHSTVNEQEVTIPLSHPEDKERLSRHQCYLREQIEIFIATAEDATTYSRGRNKRVEVGQAGLRCKHCSTIPIKDRAKGSTYFPSTLTGVYQGAQNIYHYHFCAGCPFIEKTNLSQVNEILSCRSCGGGKNYWCIAAERLGLVETGKGLRLKNYSCNYIEDESSMDSSSEVDESSIKELELAAKDTSNIVRPEDRCYATDYTFMLFSQMFACHSISTESSLPGLVCKHCEACNGSGAFFRTKISSLSKNENLTQIHKHLIECRQCPDNIKIALKNLKETHSAQTRRLRRGHKKAFFTQMMNRIASEPSIIRSHLKLNC